MLLCNINELEENQARGFGPDEDHQEIILVKRDNQVYAYKNSCPHTGVNLNWLPDQFMDMDEHYLTCSVHGALFKVEDGLCVRGPCANQHLTSLKIRIENSQVFLDQ